MYTYIYIYYFKLSLFNQLLYIYKDTFILFQDGSYTKSIPEQHDQRYNQAVFSVVQENVKENKNGLCNKCNIIQEMKVKQLACFTPTKEKYFDREIEKFK